MKTRKLSWGYIALGLFVGALIGSYISVFLALILPAGVVKDFFLLSVEFDLAGLVGNESGVIVLDLTIFTLKFGLSVAFNFTSLIGLVTAYYYLRYFH